MQGDAPCCGGPGPCLGAACHAMPCHAMPCHAMPGPCLGAGEAWGIGPRWLLSTPASGLRRRGPARGWCPRLCSAGLHGPPPRSARHAFGWVPQQGRAAESPQGRKVTHFADLGLTSLCRGHSARVQGEGAGAPRKGNYFLTLHSISYTTTVFM